VDDANRVVIGMDPHKRSVTIEVMTSDEQVLRGGRFAPRRLFGEVTSRTRQGQA
jgi:hypothetical protein